MNGVLSLLGRVVSAMLGDLNNTLIKKQSSWEICFSCNTWSNKSPVRAQKKWFFLGQALKIIFSPSQHPVSQTLQETKGSSCHCCFWKERGGAACYREINMPLRVTSEKKKKSYLLASKIAFLWWEFHFLSNATACTLVGVKSRCSLFVFLCLSDP